MNKNTGDGELEEILEELASDLNAVSYNHPDFVEKGTRGAFKVAKTAIKKYASQEANKARLMPVSDLAWCLGKLRGLGHPAEHLEKQYGLTKEKESSDV